MGSSFTRNSTTNGEWYTSIWLYLGWMMETCGLVFLVDYIATLTVGRHTVLCSRREAPLNSGEVRVFVLLPSD